jgi:hypothetical protein
MDTKILEIKIISGDWIYRWYAGGEWARALLDHGDRLVWRPIGIKYIPTEVLKLMP